MTNFIPLFPLRIVVFPGEVLNLHIFEPRYKQMILECLAEQKSFGILSVVKNQVVDDLGTLMAVTELVKTHEDGSMDIRTKALSVFQLLQRIDDVPEKLYAGAIVSYPENVLDAGGFHMSRAIVQEVKRLFTLLGLLGKFPEGREEMLSYEIAHVVGFTLQQEHEMLGLFKEIQRLEYIRRHLANIVPLIQELEEMKARIQRNGHFRELSLGDLGAG